MSVGETISTAQSQSPRSSAAFAVSTTDDGILGGSPAKTDAAAARPWGDSRYTAWWKIWLPIPLLFLVLDVGFNSYFWQIPKLSGIADDYNYQFLYDLHHLQTTPAAGVRIVAFGSSVSSGLDPTQVGGLLRRNFAGGAIEVSRLLRPGMKPSHYHLLWRTQWESTQADVAVFMVNLVDFINPTFERSLSPGIRSVLPPWETLNAGYELGFSDKLELVFASLSNLYRYRKLIHSSIRDHVKYLLALSRGGGGRPYGIYDDGNTKPRFGVIARGSLDYFVDPRWIEQRGSAELTFKVDGREVAHRSEVTAGWHRLVLPEDVADELIDVEVVGGWSPRAAGGSDSRLLGVGLRAAPPDKSLDRRRPPPRYPPVARSDMSTLMRMGGRQGRSYETEWLRILGTKTDFAHRFRLYRDAKVELSSHEFEPVAEFAELRETVREIASTGTTVLMVNTPENPILESVTHSQFYRDYLAFCEAIAAEDHRVTFLDLHDRLPAEDFNDWHHLNFAGQLKVGIVLARGLHPIVADALRGRDRGA